MGNDLFGRPGPGRQLIDAAEFALGYRLEPVCLEGSGRKVVPARQEAQVIYVLNCAYAAELREHGYVPTAVLGHSLGSWAAAWAAGVFDFLTGLELVTHVESLLEELVDGRSFGMGAIIGLDEQTVQADVAAHPGVSVANFNSPAQFVIGGTVGEVGKVLRAAAERGAKQAKLLPTTRAIHTPWMKEVAERLTDRLDHLSWHDPTTPFISCDCGQELQDGEEVREFFSAFLTRPVRWEGGFRSLKSTCASRFLEVGAGTLLTTLASFIDPTVTVRTASECLDAARENETSLLSPLQIR
jgi:malonyl CoA-acyl carrier protein transacylase